MSAFLCLVSIAMVAADDGVDLKDEFESLAAESLEPSVDGARDFLHSLDPSDQRQREIAALIRQLGDDDYLRREAASKELTRLATVAQGQLLEAASHDQPDKEIRWRSARVLSVGRQRLATLLKASLKIVAARPEAFSLDDLLPVIEHLEPQNLRFGGRRAMIAVSRPSDFESLREMANSDDAFLRRTAAAALVESTPDEDLDSLQFLLDHDDITLSQSAAIALLNRGDRRPLSVLVEQLKLPDVQLRTMAMMTLRGATGQRFALPSYETPELRNQHAAAWRLWLDENAEFEMRLPVRLAMSGRGSLDGNLLIATGREKSVREVDPDGNVVWEVKIDSWCAERIANGNSLICSHRDKRLIEVNGDGGIVWEFNGVSAMVVEPLLNGNLLIADFDGKKVIEINRDREIVWEYTADDRCFDVDRRPNGNTIVACPNKVYEVSPSGEVEASWKIDGRLNGLQILPDGNFLIANYGSNAVYEMNAAGEILWRHEISQPCDAFRLLDGTTMITTKNAVFELEPDRETRREICKASYGSARR